MRKGFESFVNQNETLKFEGRWLEWVKNEHEWGNPDLGGQTLYVLS